MTKTLQIEPFRDVKIKLTRYDTFCAATVGAKRQAESLYKKLPDKHGFDGADGWTIHIEGAAGELAVAKALNLFWDGTVNTFKRGGDIGDKLQVRTRSKDYYDLLIRQNDKDEDIFVLVVGQIPNFKVVGWMRGVDAKQEKYSQTYGNRPSAYFVPQKDLNSFPIEY